VRVQKRVQKLYRKGPPHRVSRREALEPQPHTPLWFQRAREQPRSLSNFGGVSQVSISLQSVRVEGGVGLELVEKISDS
jgi:hypothetical protein